MKKIIIGLMIFVSISGFANELVDFEEIKLCCKIKTKKTIVKYKEFDSYTFFLIPKDKWIKKGNDRAKTKLYGAFKRFGSMIEDNNIAIWFGGGPTKSNDKISSNFVNKFKKELNEKKYLDVNRGPYFVYIKPKQTNSVKIVSTQKSDVITRKISLQDLENISIYDSDDCMILDLNKLSIDCSTDLFNVLIQNLKNNSGVEPSGFMKEVIEESKNNFRKCMAKNPIKIFAGQSRDMAYKISSMIGAELKK